MRSCRWATLRDGVSMTTAAVRSRPRPVTASRPLQSAAWTAPLGVISASILYILACPPYGSALAVWAVPGLALLNLRRLRLVDAFLCGLGFALLLAYGVNHAEMTAMAARLFAEPSLQSGLALGTPMLRAALPYAVAAVLFAVLTRYVVVVAWAPLGAALWVGAEVVYTQLATIMPWEIIGLTQLHYAPMVRLVGITGMFGVSFAVAAVSIGAAQLVGSGLRRASTNDRATHWVMYCGLCGLAVACAYCGTFVMFRWVLPGHPAIAPTPAAHGLFNAALLLVMMAGWATVQEWFNRRLSRKEYEIEKALSALSKVLASARTVEHVVSRTGEVLASTVRPQQIALFVRDDEGRFRHTVRSGGAAESPVVLAPELVRRLHRGEPFAIDVSKDVAIRLAAGTADDVGPTLFVPVSMNNSTIAFMTLGRKRSGRPYDAHDLGFLRTAANQIALALTNAFALEQLGTLNKHLEQLNENLERQVEERTAELQAANENLSQSVQKMQQAYGELEHSQRSLLRADRLATLGHLTAGLAHEMNTPLSAVLNSLKIITELGQEYNSAVDDPQVLATDHHEIATEIISSAQAATQWAHKAAAFIRSVKAHGRETRPTLAQRFTVRDVVKDTRGLLAHRVRVAGCQIEFIEEPADITLVGDPGRFGQVLVNLITNAIDAYEERNLADPRLEIRATRANGVVNVQVRDWAGGIPPNVLPHIFENMFTTKGPGRGTGLGLWIARNLVEEGFGGKLDVLTTTGGSCFCATLPDRVASDDADPGEPTDPRPADSTVQVSAQSA